MHVTSCTVVVQLRCRCCLLIVWTQDSLWYVWRDSRQIVSPVRGDVAQALIFPGVVYCM